MLLPEYVYAGVRTVIVSDVVNKLSVNIFISAKYNNMSITYNVNREVTIDRCSFKECSMTISSNK